MARCFMSQPGFVGQVGASLKHTAVIGPERWAGVLGMEVRKMDWYRLCRLEPAARGVAGIR